MKGYPAAHNFPLPDMQLIPNGIDITQYHPRADTPSNEEKAHTVVCVARLSYEKGIDILLQAWNLVHREAPQARLLIVGDGPLQSQLLGITRALGLSQSITFTGAQRDIPAQLYRGSFAVSPSRWEGMPNAVLEAMACGIPCVATRVSGSEDIIQHGKNGLLVEVGDYQAMAQAILTMLRDRERTRRCGQAARLRIEQAYSLDHITDMYVALYQHIFQSRALNIQREKVTQKCVE
jgi:glycosyltransferase involved in cell wall biosynthesis